MIIAKQIRGDEFNLIEHISKCKTNEELLDVILKFIPSDALNEYNYQKEKINMTPESIKFEVYMYLKSNNISDTWKTLPSISKELGFPEEIIEKTLNILISSDFIGKYSFYNFTNKPSFYYEVI